LQDEDRLFILHDVSGIWHDSLLLPLLLGPALQLTADEFAILKAMRLLNYITFAKHRHGEVAAVENE
jgi:hypothetical protein